MKSKQDLGRLIESMSKAEKRYFKLHCTRHKSTASTRNLQLLALFERRGSLNAADLNDSDDAADLIKHFSVHKNRLYKALLSSLQEFRSADCVKTAAASMIRQVELLYERGLFNQARAMVERAREFTDKHELLPQKLDLLEVERRILENSAVSSQIEDLHAAVDRSQTVLQQLSNREEYATIRVRMIAQRKATMDSRDVDSQGQLEDMYTLPLLWEEDKALTRGARLQMYRLRSELALSCGQRRQAMLDYRLLIALWDSSPVRNEGEQERHRVDLINYLNACFAAVEYGDVEATIKKIKSYKPHSRHQEVKHFQDVSHVELLFYLNLGALENGLQLLKDIDAGLKKYGADISASRRLTIHINAALICFLAGEFRAALRWTSAIIQSAGGGLRHDIRRFTRVLNIVINYELGEIEHCLSLMRSAKRFLEKDDAQDFEYTLVKVLPRIVDARSPAEVRAGFEDLHLELRSRRAALEAATPAGLDAVLLWTASKVERSDILTVYRAALKQRDAAQNVKRETAALQ